MKKPLIALGSCLLMSNVTVASSFSDTARIISVKEIFRTETIRKPYQICEEKMVIVEERTDSDPVSTIAGAIVGGVVGNQFGKGSGNVAMTAAGAALGGAIGAESSSGTTSSARTINQCRTEYNVEHRNVLDHYQVTYDYNGQLQTWKTAKKPSGDTLRVYVNVTPNG
ncbi:glycine zipper 2TM domain-containing protein [Endozoicomonas euniceicola]|uniref:Glycine zipper 2TM domain-containing protein n=1 Tax=Endozoicomonas euniceicola TaxID=1234143 RepID=A0ABY6GSA9_9GAMM|nr:glycine zipper 2TM domain-containing protein [Endozoicomonas euniceicola]UYM15635.1 glycine zipper 2TM domain-containing protein [Endozoicomonas euniceicola]